MTKLVRKLMPCNAPSDHAHAIDVDSHDSVQYKIIDSAANNSSAPPAGSSEKQDEVKKELEKPTFPVIIDREASLLSTQTTLPEVDVDVSLMPTTTFFPRFETEGMTSGAVQPLGSTGTDTFSPLYFSRDDTSYTSSRGTKSHTEDISHTSTGSENCVTYLKEGHGEKEVPEIEEVEPMDDALIMDGGTGIPTGPDGVQHPLLPPISSQHKGRKCLVLDLDETLVHSSFESLQHADYIVPVEIECLWHDVNVTKRPGVDDFLKKMGEIYEVVVFTASVSKFADPVLDKLDIHQAVSHRLFRESCYSHNGDYVKDLSQLGRPLASIVILDNSPASYTFHPNNAIPVSSWFNDPHDTELTDLCPFLVDLGGVRDVRGVLDADLSMSDGVLDLRKKKSRGL